MRKALQNYENSIAMGGRKVHELRYADDVVLIADTIENLQEMVDRIKGVSEEYGLFLHPAKTKAMKISRETQAEAPLIKIDDNEVEFVDSFCYLGYLINNKNNDSIEIRRRIGTAKSACLALTKIWKDNSISKNMKMRILRSLVFPIAIFGAECWSLKLSDKQRLETFELWCYRRLLRISWVDRRTNIWILDQIKPEMRFLEMAEKLKLQYFGHVARKSNIENAMLTGAVYGNRGRGRCRTRWTDGVKDRLGCSITHAIRKAQDRAQWRRLVRMTTAARANGNSV